MPRAPGSSKVFATAMMLAVERWLRVRSSTTVSGQVVRISLMRVGGRAVKAVDGLVGVAHTEQVGVVAGHLA